MIYSLTTHLTPDGDEAREWVQEELSHAEYSTDLNPLTRFIRTILEFILKALSGDATATPPVDLLILGAFIISLVVLVIIVLLNPIRLRHRSSTSKVFDEENVSIDDALARFVEARQQQAWEDACVWAFRVVVLRLVAVGVLRDAPGLTALEAATRAGSAVPSLHSELREAAHLFDEVRYGDYRARSADADSLIHLAEQIHAQAPQIRSQAAEHGVHAGGETLSSQAARGSHTEQPRLAVRK